MKLISKCCKKEAVKRWFGYLCTNCLRQCDTIETKEEKEEVKEDRIVHLQELIKGFKEELKVFGETPEDTEKLKGYETELKDLLKTPTPNDWISEKIEELCTIQGYNEKFSLMCKTELKDLLTQQKEAIEKEWREKIKKLLEEIYSIKFGTTLKTLTKEETNNGYKAISRIEEMIKNQLLQ